MDRWENRVVLVSGAGAGIGACISMNLVKKGLVVIGCARNIKPIDDLAEELKTEKGKLISYKCDLSNEAEIEKMFEWIKANHKGVDVLINNAGHGSMTPLLDLGGDEMRGMWDVNVVAPVLCAKLAVKSMLERGVNDGHIFNISSMLGHSVIGILNFYAATKFAINAFTQGLRKELAEKGSRIRVTMISPGRVESHFHATFMKDERKVKEFYSKVESLKPQDVADGLLYALATPESVQVYDVQIQPVSLGSVAAYK